MSGGKHAIYQMKILGADGLNKPMMIGGGDGTPTSGAGPLVRLDGYWDLADTAPTLTAQQHAGTIVGTPTANRAYTTLTGAQLEAAFPNIPVGGTWDLHIANLAGATHSITLTAGASGVTVRGGAIAAAESATFRVIKTAASTYVFSRAYGA